jgi:GntR family transcriptional regulator, transcriptional repressor for pyruvate dehydrogenase complex
MEFQSVLLTRSYEQVVQQIRDRIRAGTLVSGQKLPTERELAESFGVSRGVIREAIKVLASMGLVESRQGSGTYVRANTVPSISRALTFSVTAEERSLLSLFELREPIEIACARLAAARRSPEQAALIRHYADESARAATLDNVDAFGRAEIGFHGTIGEAAASPYLATVMSAVRDVQSNVVSLVVRIVGSMQIASGQHQQIAEAISRTDVEGASEAMMTHVHYSADAVRQFLTRPHDEQTATGFHDW